MSNPQLAPEAEALLPCPHEHSQRVLGLNVVPLSIGNQPRWHVGCLDCGAEGPRAGTRDSAITAWNRRAPVSTGAVAPEPAGWRWRWASDNHWRAFGAMSTEASRAHFIRNQEKFAPIVVEPLYTHPAPADTGQGGRVEELEAALRSAVLIADEAAEEWDKAPDGMRAGKLLLALAGHAPGYRRDTDAIHDALDAGART